MALKISDFYSPTSISRLARPAVVAIGGRSRTTRLTLGAYVDGQPVATGLSAE
ncbi:MAG TPA: hypothetical protein VFA78_08025 [Chloroflexota bacterium]|nr:hypothetical protein [Chloroflexota bacterium]